MAAHQVARVKRTEGTYATTSTSFVDVDTANLAITMTIEAGSWVRLTLLAIAAQTGNYHSYFDFTEDDTRLGEAYGLTNHAYAVYRGLVVVHEYQPSAGQHTWRPQWRVNAGTGTLWASTDTTPLLFIVEELREVA